MFNFCFLKEYTFYKCLSPTFLKKILFTNIVFLLFEITYIFLQMFIHAFLNNLPFTTILVGLLQKSSKLWSFAKWQLNPLCKRPNTGTLYANFQRNILDFYFRKICILSATFDVCSFFTISLHAKSPPFYFDWIDLNSASKERQIAFFSTNYHWHCFVAEAEREKRIREGGQILLTRTKTF